MYRLYQQTKDGTGDDEPQNTPSQEPEDHGVCSHLDLVGSGRPGTEDRESLPKNKKADGARGIDDDDGGGGILPLSIIRESEPRTSRPSRASLKKETPPSESYNASTSTSTSTSTSNRFLSGFPFSRRRREHVTANLSMNASVASDPESLPGPRWIRGIRGIRSGAEPMRTPPQQQDDVSIPMVEAEMVSDVAKAEVVEEKKTCGVERRMFWVVLSLISAFLLAFLLYFFLKDDEALVIAEVTGPPPMNLSPSVDPTTAPTSVQENRPSALPSFAPTRTPSSLPSNTPSLSKSAAPTIGPTFTRYSSLRNTLQTFFFDETFPASTAQADALFWIANLDDAEMPVDSDPGSLLDRYILAVFSTVAGGTSWLPPRNWFSSISVCGWEHVFCNDNERINIIDMEYVPSALRGVIPTELGLLTELNEINFWTNQLKGQIPSTLGKLTQLFDLHLGWNDLTGTIPTEVGLMTRLVQMNLQNNIVGGPIPSEIGSLSNLYLLYLLNNRLVGTIPTELGMLTQLDHLLLNSNRLTGTVPIEVFNLNIGSFSYDGNAIVEKPANRRDL